MMVRTVGLHAVSGTSLSDDPMKPIKNYLSDEGKDVGFLFFQGHDFPCNPKEICVKSDGDILTMYLCRGD